MIPCDLCGADDPQVVLRAPGLDGPLVRCRACGLHYVGERNSRLTFGSDSAEQTADRVRQTNAHFRQLELAEEHRRQVVVVVLPGVHEHLLVALAQHPRHGRRFHELRPVSDEREDAHPGIPDRFEPSDNEVWPHAFSVTR